MKTLGLYRGPDIEETEMDWARAGGNPEMKGGEEIRRPGLGEGLTYTRDIRPPGPNIGQANRCLVVHLKKERKKERKSDMVARLPDCGARRTGVSILCMMITRNDDGMRGGKRMGENNAK